MIQTTEQPARFVYVTNKSGRKVTVAYVYDDANKSIRLATAECSKRDQFVKRIGREIAFGRLTVRGGSPVEFSTIGGTSYGDIARFVSANVDSLGGWNGQV